MKTHLSISIDTATYAKAKAKIPNISAYIEAILKRATIGEVKGAGIGQLTNQLKEQEAKLAVLSEELRKAKAKAKKEEGGKIVIKGRNN